MYKLDFEEAEEPEIKLPTFFGSSIKQESSRKASTSALLTMPKPLTAWITTNCGKFFKRWNYQTPDLPPEKSVCRSRSNSQNWTKKDLHDPDNHNDVITHLEPDILEWEVKWALGSITTNKASGGNGIPVELFQILKDDAVKVLHSKCQHIWKTQQWPQD